MRKLNNYLSAGIGFLIGVLFFGICHLNHDLKIEAKDKNLEFVHSRDSLVIDSLKSDSTRCMATNDLIMGVDSVGFFNKVDTASFITEHSEIPEKLVSRE